MTTMPADDTARALCRDDPELFFPVTYTGPGAVQAEKARSWCLRCPLLAPCREYAQTADDDWGVLGGTLPAERRRG